MKAMKKLTLLLATLALTFVTAAPVLAQGEPSTQRADSAGALAQGTEGSSTVAPPDYMLDDDGTVIIDGDIAMDCRSFALSLRQGQPLENGNIQQAQSVLQQCEQEGLLASQDEGLPDTGGPPILAIAWLSSGTPFLGFTCYLLARRNREKRPSQQQ